MLFQRGKVRLRKWVLEMPLEEENEPTFFVDAMLGNIAKKLRLMGYDSSYFADIEDDLMKQYQKSKI